MSSSDDKPIVIRKSNELISARYRLSIAEQRLVLLLTSEISINDEDFKDYEIRVSDFARMFGLETDKSLYEKVEQAAESLLSQKIRLQDNHETELTTWLSYVRYIKGSGLLMMRFDKSVKPYLLQLKTHFTQYHLNYVIDFKNQYSIRFYELLKMDAFKAKNNKFDKYFDMKELRIILGIPKNEYTLFADFKRRVIESAVKEVNQKTDLIIEEVIYGKTGRKFTNVKIVVLIRTQEEILQQQYKLENAQAKAENESHPIIEKMVSLGFSEEIAKKYKNKYGIKRLERNIAYTLAKKQENLVKDIPAYLNKAIESDLGGAWDIKQQKETVEKQQKADIEKAKQAEEARAKQARQAQYTQAFERFMALPDEQKNLIKTEFIQYSDETLTKKMRQLENSGKNFFDSPMVAGVFKTFLIREKGF